MGCQRLMKDSPTSLASENGRVNLCYTTLTQTAPKKTYKLFKVPKRRYLFSSFSHLSGSVTMDAFWCSRFLMRCQSSIIFSFVLQTFQIAPVTLVSVVAVFDPSGFECAFPVSLFLLPFTNRAQPLWDIQLDLKKKKKIYCSFSQNTGHLFKHRRSLSYRERHCLQQNKESTAYAKIWRVFHNQKQDRLRKKQHHTNKTI